MRRRGRTVPRRTRWIGGGGGAGGIGREAVGVCAVTGVSGRAAWSGGEAPEDGEGRAAFVYGSLLFGPVLEALLGRVPESREGRVRGWHRFRIRGQVYPAVARVEGAEVVGRVLLGLSPEEKDLLDWFEDEEYVKVPVTVAPCGTEAWIYAREEVGGDLHGAWDAEAFERDHLMAFAEMCVGCRAEYLLLGNAQQGQGREGGRA